MASEWPELRPASGLRWLRTPPFPSFIHIFLRLGGTRARKSCPSRRWPMKRRRSADAVWLPGGYPELHAGRLAANSNFLAGVRAFAGKGPVHGECGGYMVLGDGLIGEKGERFAMLGLLRLETSFAARKLHLGYRRAELQADCILGRHGDRFAGHEFHYCTVLAEQGEALFSVADAEGAPVLSTGLRHGNVTGSFFHLIDSWG